MKKFNKTKARLAILNYIVTQCLSRNYGEGMQNIGGFSNHYFRLEKPHPGDLVALSAAPPSEWYLSWYIDCEKRNNDYDDKHLLESIETGKLCNWSNVSFYVLCREILAEHPEWKWTDRQYEFKERWLRSCYRTRETYWSVPMFPVFDNHDGVVLRVRAKFNFGNLYQRKFPNWKKLRIKNMLEFYDQCVAAHNTIY